MPPLFSNKKLIILLTSLIVLVALIGFSLKERRNYTWAEQFVQDSAGLFQLVFNKPAQYVTEITDNISEMRHVYKENELLKKQLEDYANLNKKYILTEQENEELKAQLHMQDDPPSLRDFKSVRASVIARSFDNFNKLVIVNKGAQQGIEPGMAVTTSSGFIGKVIEAGQFTSKIALITDASNDNQISAEVYNGKDEKSKSFIGMIEGYDNKKNVLLLKKLPLEADIKKGYTVITSGLGGVYPKGLIIGKIKKVEPDENGLTLKATIEPAADTRHLTYVNIVKRLAAEPKEGGGS